MTSAQKSRSAPVRALDLVEKAVALLVGLLLAGIVFIMLLAIWSRYIENDSLAWTEQVSRILFVWITFLGAAVLYRRGAHIAIDFFLDLMPRRLAAIVRAANETMMLGLFLVLLIYGAKLSISNLGQTYGALDVSPSTHYFAAPVSAALMILFWLERAAIGLERARRPGAREDSA
ncbi:TRAP transporter small permease [Pikeienuella sp. HZG-20]|uniref:TRAP transporter small permease n=1 Tax=Paludibacillus litoralis TaxID=3133267 RepID=UPI0030EC0871